jgi:serine/threonine-protein kinase
LTFFFSPDSETIAFVADRKLQRVALDGGPVTTICDVPPEVRGGSWGEGDTIVFADATGGLMRVWAGGGPAEPLTRLDPGEFSHRWPQILPGGKAVVFSSNTAPDWWTRARIDVVSLDDGRRRRLQDRATFGRFVVDSDGTGFITFVRAGTLFAAAFDPIRLELRSAPFPVLEQVAPDISGGAQVDGSRTGAVLTRVQPRVSIVWLDGSGPSPLLAEPGDYQGPELSHDGNRVAFSSGEDLWVYDVQRAVRTQLTKGLGVARPKIWSPDDQFIVFSTPEGIWWVRSDGGSEPRLLLPAKKPAVRIATSMNADRRGSRLGFQQVASDSEARWDLWTAPVHIDATGMRAGEPEPFLKTADNEHTFQFSPDGRWVAYTSTEAGGPNEIHVRAFPDDGRRWKLSERGGLSPRWSHGRSELFFRAGESLMVVPYSVNGGVFNAGNPRAWSRQRLPHYVERGSGPFSVSRDGRRIVTLVADQVADERFRGHVTLWLNAVAEFRRRIPASP